MDYSKQIHDFVDGGLDPSKEEQLFYALSSNEEFREELKETIRLEKSFKTRLSEMAPSAASTVGVFDKLGFNTPGALTPAAETAKTGFMAKYGQGLFSSLGTVALAVVAYFIFLQPGTSEQNFADNSNQSNNNTVVDQTNAQSNIPFVTQTNESNSEQIQSNSSNTSGSDRNQFVAASNDNMSNSKSSKYNLALNQDLNKSWADQIDKMSGNVVIGSDGKPYLALNVAYQLTEVEKSKIEQFITEMRKQNPEMAAIPTDNTKSSRDIAAISFSNINDKLEYTSGGVVTRDETPEQYKFSHRFTTDNYVRVPMETYTPYIDGPPVDPIGMSFEIKTNTVLASADKGNFDENLAGKGNLQVTLIYALDENWSIGADYRQETFYQEFSHTDLTGNTFIVRQEPAFNSFSGVVRYRYNDFGKIVPIGQFMIGGTEVGYTIRPMIGAEYSPVDFLSFLVGLEHSTLMYNQDGTYFSPKLGMNFGVAVKF